MRTYYILIGILLFFIGLVGFGMIGIKTDSFEISPFILLELGVSIVGILVTISIFVFSLRISSVNQSLINAFLSDEKQRKVFLNLKNGNTLDELNRKISSLSDAEISSALTSLENNDLLTVKKETVENTLIKKYYKNI